MGIITTLPHNPQSFDIIQFYLTFCFLQVRTGLLKTQLSLLSKDQKLWVHSSLPHVLPRLKVVTHFPFSSKRDRIACERRQRQPFGSLGFPHHWLLFLEIGLKMSSLNQPSTRRMKHHSCEKKEDRLPSTALDAENVLRVDD